MKPFISCLLVLCLAACGRDSDDRHRAAAPTTPDCTKIRSSVERLACFDAVARTPAEPPAPAATATSTPDMVQQGSTASSLITSLAQRNETQRKADDHRFLLSRSRDEAADTLRIVISAPALGSEAPSPLMTISCLSGISRLQVIAAKPVPHNRIRMQLLMDGNPIADATTWQVLDAGNIVDAGRGLVAIDTLKRMGSGGRLQTQSDYPPLDGLIFDATGLSDLIAQQREACRW